MSIDGQGSLWRRNIGENFNRLSRVHQRYRQTDDRRQTDGPSMTYSEHELEFTFAKNYTRAPLTMMKHPLTDIYVKLIRFINSSVRLCRKCNSTNLQLPSAVDTATSRRSPSSPSCQLTRTASRCTTLVVSRAKQRVVAKQRAAAAATCGACQFTQPRSKFSSG